MVEQPEARKGHSHAVLVAGFNEGVIPRRAAGLDDICHAAPTGAVDVVSKWDEGVAAQANAVDVVDELVFFFP